MRYIGVLPLFKDQYWQILADEPNFITTVMRHKHSFVIQYVCGTFYIWTDTSLELPLGKQVSLPLLLLSPKSHTIHILVQNVCQVVVSSTTELRRKRMGIPSSLPWETPVVTVHIWTVMSLELPLVPVKHMPSVPCRIIWYPFNRIFFTGSCWME